MEISFWGYLVMAGVINSIFIAGMITGAFTWKNWKGIKKFIKNFLEF